MAKPAAHDGSRAEARVQAMLELVPDADQGWFREASAQIIFHHRLAPMEIGRILAEGKQRLRHGLYMTWVEKVCCLDVSTANNYRKAWLVFQDDTDIWDVMHTTAMYVLAGKEEWHSKAAEEARRIAREENRVITRQLAKELVLQFKPDSPPTPDFEADPESEDVDEDVSRVSAEELEAGIEKLDTILRHPEHLLQNAIDNGYDIETIIQKLEGLAAQAKACVTAMHVPAS